MNKQIQERKSKLMQELAQAYHSKANAEESIERIKTALGECDVIERLITQSEGPSLDPTDPE